MTAQQTQPQTVEFPSINLAEIYERHEKEIERLQAKLGEAWQTIGGLKYHYRTAVEEAEKLRAKIRELEQRGTVDDEIIREALLENVNVEVVREWDEDRYSGTSNHYREHFAEYAADPVTIEIDNDVERIPVYLVGTWSKQDGLQVHEVELHFELSRVWIEKRIPRWVYFAEYDVEVSA